MASLQAARRKSRATRSTTATRMLMERSRRRFRQHGFFRAFFLPQDCHRDWVAGRNKKGRDVRRPGLQGNHLKIEILTIGLPTPARAGNQALCFVETKEALRSPLCSVRNDDEKNPLRSLGKVSAKR